MEKSIINLSDLNGRNGFRLDGVAAYDWSGRSVSSAGDINGDGFVDVIVATQRFGSSANDSSYVIFGRASGFEPAFTLSDLNGSNGFRLDGVARSDYSGNPVSAAGDVNGDGFGDLLIGTPGADLNGESSGASYVVFGKPSGFNATLSLSNLTGDNGFRLKGVTAGDSTGCSVSNAGDVNGDGFDDVIVGARGTDPNGFESAGSSYVVFGKAYGFSATVDLSSLNGSNGFRMDGEGPGDYSATTVSNAGDVNGDGFADLIVNAPLVYPHGYDSYAGSGSSYVMFGKASGFSAVIGLSSLDGNNGFRLDGVATYDVSKGFSVSGAGDINGDGYDDLIIGEAYFHSHGNPIDANYVVFGKATGFSATLALSDLDGSNGFRMNGPGGSISSAGDVNGDGFDDLFIGDPLAQTTGPAGASFVVYGKASGFTAVIDVFNLNGDRGLRLDGVEPNDHSGDSVSNAGDVNGDGFDDLIIGAPDADSNGDGSGSSYVVFGGNFTHSVTFSGTSKADNLNQGTQAAERFVAGNGNDTMIGRGGVDVFHGGLGNDYIRVRDLNFQLVDGGTGRDTLGLGNSNLNLDLADVRGKISGIETIYLYGTGDNTLTLSALDLLNLSDTSNTLKVNGDAGDHVVGLDNGWEDGGIYGGFHTYTHDEAVLLVGVNVMTDFIEQ